MPSSFRIIFMLYLAKKNGWLLLNIASICLNLFTLLDFYLIMHFNEAVYKNNMRLPHNDNDFLYKGLSISWFQKHRTGIRLIQKKVVKQNFLFVAESLTLMKIP